MATRADVARLAGVSASTVTYALTGERPISARTRERIEHAMAELGYAPNALARALAGRRSRILALLIPSGIRPIISSDLEYVVAAADEARGLGYHVVLWTTEGNDLDEIRRLARTGLVDGVLLMEVLAEDERVGLLAEAGTPVCLIGRTGTPGLLPFADADFEQMARLSVDHLAALGHSDLLLLGEPPGAVQREFAGLARLVHGIVQAAAEHGMSLRTVEAQRAAAAGREAFDLVWGSGGRCPTGVVSVNWQATLGLVQQAQLRGVVVPDELSVVSVSSSDEHADVVLPALTTVCPDATAIGRSAARALVAALEGDPEPRQTLFPGRLVRRGTTAHVPSLAR